MILLGYLFGLSEKRLCDELGMHMGYRWFCRLQPSDKVPDRTTLVKLRNDRWKQDIWMKLLDRTVSACIEAGLVSGRHVSIDGTQIHADASIHSLEPIEPPASIRDHLLKVAGWEKFVPRDESKSDDDDAKPDDAKPDDAKDFHGKKLSNEQLRSKTDPDARLFRKSKGVGATLSYLGHLCMDTKSCMAGRERDISPDQRRVDGGCGDAGSGQSAAWRQAEGGCGRQGLWSPTAAGRALGTRSEGTHPGSRKARGEEVTATRRGASSCRTAGRIQTAGRQEATGAWPKLGSPSQQNQGLRTQPSTTPTSRARHRGGQDLSRTGKSPLPGP